MSNPKKLNSPSRSFGVRVPAQDWNEFERFKKIRSQRFKSVTAKKWKNTDAFMFVFRLGLQTALKQIGDKTQQ